MEFSRQEYWSGLPCLPPGHLPDPGIEPASLASPVLAGGFFPTAPPGRPRDITRFSQTKHMPQEPGVTVASTHPHQCWILKSHRQVESQICKSHECCVEHLRLSACPACWGLECGFAVPARGTRVSSLPRQPAASHSQTLQEQCQQEGPLITACSGQTL